MILEDNQVKELLEKIKDLEIRNSTKSNYSIDDKRVPRVTEILSSMMHEDNLMNWANGLGWKRISYRAFMKDSQDKGTYSHLAIEIFLRQGRIDLDTDLQIPNTAILAGTWKSTLNIKGIKRTEQKQNAQKYVLNEYNIKATQDECDAICIGSHYIQTNKPAFDWSD